MEHDERRGLYGKYIVRRRDGSSEPRGKHENCDYFVLDWWHDKFAVPAALRYADACESEFPELARDIRKRAAQAAAVFGIAVCAEHGDRSIAFRGPPESRASECYKCGADRKGRP